MKIALIYGGTVGPTPSGVTTYHGSFTHKGERFLFMINSKKNEIKEEVLISHPQMGKISSIVNFPELSESVEALAEKMIQEFKEEFLRCG
jgi:hypothetical protein